MYLLIWSFVRKNKLPVYFAIVELFPVPVDPTQIIQLPILSSSSALCGADTGIDTFPTIDK